MWGLASVTSPTIQTTVELRHQIACAVYAGVDLWDFPIKTLRAKKQVWIRVSRVRRPCPHSIGFGNKLSFLIGSLYAADELIGFPGLEWTPFGSNKISYKCARPSPVSFVPISITENDNFTRDLPTWARHGMTFTHSRTHPFTHSCTPLTRMFRA